MKHPRREVLALLAFILAVSTLAPRPVHGEEGSPWSLRTELDLYLGLKAGLDYRVSDSFSLRATLGACLISPLQASYTLVGVEHLLPEREGLQVDLEFGLIQAIANLLEPSLDFDPAIDGIYAYWVPGLCIALGHRSATGRVLALRAGGGISLGYDLDRWQRPGFLLNLGLEYGQSLGGRKKSSD